MALHLWHREHGADVTAQVHPTDEARWIASGWKGATCVQTHKRHFRLLTEAQAMADTLVAEVFGHICRDPNCGAWRRAKVDFKS
jgi:hypothetical protein